MKTYICEICGDAYIGSEIPSKCPFCGADRNYIKLGNKSLPIFKRKEKIGDISKRNLIESLNLEIKASAVYFCMAKKTSNYEIKRMYKRLAKIELEHAIVISKLLKIKMSEVVNNDCSDRDLEKFKKTVELESHAIKLYERFIKEAEEKKVKIFFTALAKVEREHVNLIQNYIS